MLDQGLRGVDDAPQMHECQQHPRDREQVEQPAVGAGIADGLDRNEGDGERHGPQAAPEVDRQVTGSGGVPAKALGPPDRVDEERQREDRDEDRRDHDQEDLRPVHQAGKTAIVAVKPWRKLRPPTGPISPAQKKPPAGAPREASIAEASWAGTSNMCEPRPFQVNSRAPEAPSEPSASA